MRPQLLLVQLPPPLLPPGAAASAATRAEFASDGKLAGFPRLKGRAACAAVAATTAAIYTIARDALTAPGISMEPAFAAATPIGISFTGRPTTGGSTADENNAKKYAETIAFLRSPDGRAWIEHPRPSSPRSPCAFVFPSEHGARYIAANGGAGRA